MEKSMTDAENKAEKRRSSTAAISSSSESETFETWTLVTPELPTDRGKEHVQEAKVSCETSSKLKAHSNQQDQEERTIENIKKDDIHTDGEISDGISIISDSESGGRSSPQPTPRRLSPTKRHSPPKSSLVEQSDEENDSDNTDGMSKSVIRTVYDPLTPPNTPDASGRALSPESIAEEIMDVRQNRDRDNDSSDSETDRPRSHEINFTYAFFMALFIAILAIFGRMKCGPMLDTNDLSAVYSKLNEILSKTSHIEAIIQDTMNGLDDRSFDQYSNMLMRMQELNEKFEKNNLAMKDALFRLTKNEKYPALNPDKERVKTKEQQTNDIDTNADNPVVDKPPKSNRVPHQNSRGAQDPRPQHENSRSPQTQERFNKKSRSDQVAPKGDKFENAEPKQKNDHKKRESHKNDQYEQKDTRKEPYENGKREAARKPASQEYDARRKNGYKEKNSNGHYKENNFKKNSGEQQEDWMERRRISREDARKAGKDSGEKRDDDSNWYLERGTGRQKARRYEKVDGVE